jgi:hypothetical protein
MHGGMSGHTGIGHPRPLAGAGGVQIVHQHMGPFLGFVQIETFRGAATHRNDLVDLPAPRESPRKPNSSVVRVFLPSGPGVMCSEVVRVKT